MDDVCAPGNMCVKLRCLVFSATIVSNGNGVMTCHDIKMSLALCLYF